jgi:hypothetical protein
MCRHSDDARTQLVTIGVEISTEYVRLEVACHSDLGDGPSSSAPHRVFQGHCQGRCPHAPGALGRSCIRYAVRYDTAWRASRERARCAGATEQA